MKKRGRGNTGVQPGAGEDVEAAVRATARSIAERFETGYPYFEDLADDEEFLSSSERLVDPEVTFATVARLSRGSLPILAAMAHRAAWIRDDVPEDWVEWAFRRLKQAYAGEALFLLRAIERHGEPPYIARVLARADHDWTEGWLNSVVGAFVAQRIEAGERPTASDFDQAVKEPDEDLVALVVASLEGVLPEDTIREFHGSRERRARLTFFKSFARIWEPRAEPTLTTVGGRSAVIDELRALLGGQATRSALVVGEHGAGKSAVIREALRELQDDGWFVFEAGAADVHAGQSYIGQLEGRVHEIVAQLAEERAVWVMPAFEDALWAGQHSRSERGLLDALRPFVETGQLAIVGELEPRAYELLVQKRPRVTDLFETLRLEPLTSEEAIAVAQDWREHAGVDVDDGTIRDAQDLAVQYLAGAGCPAGLLRLLKAAAADASAAAEEPIRLQQVLETLAGATGLPLHVVDPEAPLDLDEVRQFFSTRVLGQQEAVDCLVDRIALIKAKLTDPTRPLGVFLLVGPTGTGKTELAKVLAEFLFGSPDRLVRLDMSEFQTEDSMERLLADSSSEAEAATLISSVRAKPFSVVLLDEFEKAHRNFWNVFLQLFDDGRLTDRQGRTADFRQCVVILTSNVGSALETGAPLGFGRERGARFSQAAVQRELSRVFRPELLNRIDRIVVFRPFEREQMRALLERELQLVLERRGFRDRPWVVEWDEAALDLLLAQGVQRRARRAPAQAGRRAAAACAARGGDRLAQLPRGRPVPLRHRAPRSDRGRVRRSRRRGGRGCSASALACAPPPGSPRALAQQRSRGDRVSAGADGTSARHRGRRGLARPKGARSRSHEEQGLLGLAGAVHGPRPDRVRRPGRGSPADGGEALRPPRSPEARGRGGAGPRPAAGAEALPARPCVRRRRRARTGRRVSRDQMAGGRPHRWGLRSAAARHVRVVGAATWDARGAPDIGVEPPARVLGHRRVPDPRDRDRPACLRDAAGRAVLRTGGGSGRSRTQPSRTTRR
jgi:ATP-dependent Clp protease ATP-binding subunit ClpC